MITRFASCRYRAWELREGVEGVERLCPPLCPPSQPPMVLTGRGSPRGKVSRIETDQKHPRERTDWSRRHVERHGRRMVGGRPGPVKVTRYATFSDSRREPADIVAARAPVEQQPLDGRAYAMGATLDPDALSNGEEADPVDPLVGLCRRPDQDEIVGDFSNRKTLWNDDESRTGRRADELCEVLGHRRVVMG
jgi:hypothetical protein